jgi:SAM-dependent methyltransferase
MTKWMILADQMLRNAAMAIPAVAEWRCRKGRTSIPCSAGVDLLDKVAYRQYRMVTDILGESAIDGKVVGEIGPGDHIPAAMLFIGAGAKRYVAFDRFLGNITSRNAKNLYDALFHDIHSRHTEMRDRLKAAGIIPDKFPEGYPTLIQYENRSIESALAEYDSSFDILFSFNAVEHCFDIRKFAENCFRMLKPLGVAVHRIDFGPHDTWVKSSNPFEWLTVRDTLWNIAGSRRGVPNRKRFHEICTSLIGVGFSLDTIDKELYPEELVSAVQPFMDSRFRKMPIESLRVKTALLKCVKEIRPVA